MTKGEIAQYEQCLLLLQCFLNPYAADVSESVFMWGKVNKISGKGLILITNKCWLILEINIPPIILNILDRLNGDVVRASARVRTPVGP